MDSEEARKVLGLQPEEDWSAHMPAFLAARQKMADLVRQSPTEALAIRYQEGLMEFDKALAFFRAQDELKQRALREHIAEQEASEEIAEEAVIESPSVAVQNSETEMEKSTGRSWLLAFLLVAILAGGGYLGYQEILKRQADDRQIQLAQWESEAADHVSKRRWQEALNLYTQIESATPGSPVSLMGRRSIEAGMREEHDQYIAYWTGEAVAAFEASNWSDAEIAIQKVQEFQPKHPEMLELLEKLNLRKSASERERLAKEAQAAIDQEQWEIALQRAEQWLEIEAKSEPALAILNQAKSGMTRALEQKKQALLLVEKARKLDNGQYQKEVHDLVTEAKKLAPRDADILAFYEKIASYARTLRVPSEFTDLQKAFAEANDRDRIVIEQGTYQGPFSLNSAAIIESHGGAVILECPSEKGPALSLGAAAQGARITGLHMQHSDFTNEPERFSAVLVDGAQVHFFDCEFRRAAGHGLVLIHGAQVKAERCRFIENGWNGLTAQGEKSDVTLLDSLCQANFHHGIEIWQDAAATLQNNRSLENSQNGLHLDTSAKVTIKNNQFSSNREFGAVIHRAGSGTMSENKLSLNLLGGIVVAKAASELSLEKNLVDRNDGPALMLGKGLSSAAYQKNQLQAKSGQKSILTDVPME